MAVISCFNKQILVKFLHEHWSQQEQEWAIDFAEDKLLWILFRNFCFGAISRQSSFYAWPSAGYLYTGTVGLSGNTTILEKSMCISYKWEWINMILRNKRK